jgi:hypothetical protein
MAKERGMGQTLSDEKRTFEVDVRGETVCVDLWYPPRGSENPDKRARAVEIGLVDVRAADDIRIAYDFERDGWVIQQQPELEEDDEDEAPWVEVAFIAAWGCPKRWGSALPGG